MNIDIKGYVSLLLKYLKKHKKLVFLLILSTLGSLVMTLVKPKILSTFVDSIKDKPINTLFLLGILFLFAVLSSASLSIFMQYVTENLGWSTTNDLRIDLTRHLINLDMSFHKKFSAGQLIERIDGDIQNLFNFFTTFVTGITFNSIIIVGSIIYLGILDWRFLLIEVISVILFALYMFSIRDKVKSASLSEREAISDYYGCISEQVTSIEEIRAFKLQNYITNKNRKIFRKDFASWGIVMKYEFASWSIMNLLTAFSYVSTFILAAYLVYHNRLTVGESFAIFYILKIMWSPLGELRAELQYMQSAEAAIQRINELLSYKRDLSSGDAKFPEKADIKVEHLCFAYEDDKDTKVLDDISFTVKKGEKIGILGRTGSGKTTLAKLLVKFHDADSGNIVFGDSDDEIERDIHDISDEELRKNISYLTQEVQVFNSSVRNNLTLFRKDITDEMIKAVIEKIGLEEWFKKLPKGLDTEITDDSSFLSAGEMQLLTVLRMFLTNPKVIVLDEATAKLDPVTEKYISKSIDLLMKDRTTIIIAHRLKTILKTDRILILENGRVIENGLTTELKANPDSVFSSLLETGLEEVLR